MAVIRQISEGITWVGGSDRRLALFENLFPLENGVTYNSFLIRDEQTALIDTVDAAIAREFLDNIREALNGRNLDYLVINHMEPDHCDQIDALRLLYPGVKIVGNSKTFQMIRQFYDMDLTGCALEVKEGDSLHLGKHSLSFLMAPMVHWPEVMFTFESTTGLLFSADAFGSFGGFHGAIFSDEDDYRELHLSETRRYYSNIVGKYGPQVQRAMKKAQALDIRMIAPLHGPVLRGEDMALVLAKYDLWSRYEPEERGVLIAYGSMYGNTEQAAHLLAAHLTERGVHPVRLFDVSKAPVSDMVAQAFRLSHWVFAVPTYNAGLYAPMEALLRDLMALNLCNRDVALIANGSWSMGAEKVMADLLCQMKDMRLMAEPLCIRSAMKEAERAQLAALADQIAEGCSGGSAQG